MVEQGVRANDDEALLRAGKGDVGAIEVKDEAGRRANRMRIALGAGHDDRRLLAALQPLDGVDEADGDPMLRKGCLE